MKSTHAFLISKLNQPKKRLVFGAAFAVFCFGCLATPAHAATYYMRADGSVTSANKANATGCGATSTALNVSNHNSATFAPGDTIYLCDAGGNYTTALIPPTSGSAGNPITYINAPGSSPTINIASNTLNFYINGKSYINLSNITLGNTNAAAAAAPIYTAGIVDHINYSNLTLSATNGHLIYITGTGTNLTFDHLTGTVGSGGGYAVLSSTAGPNSNYTISNSTFTNGKGIRIDNNASSTISNVTLSTSTLNAVYLNNDSNVLVQDVTANSISQVAFYDTTSTNITYRRAIANISGGGFASLSGSGNVYDSTQSIGETGTADYQMLGNSHDYSYTNDLSENGTGDGFVITDNAYNATYSKCISIGNGNKNTESVGDGFTAHQQNHGLKYDQVISANNITSGFAMIDNSEGKISNSIVYGNSSPWNLTGGAVQDRGGVYIGVSGLNSDGKSWVVKNNIVENNYPYEINLTTSSAPIVSLDYNLIWPRNASQTATVDFGVTPLTWAQYHISPYSYEPHSLNADPLFVSTSSLNFHVQTSSPAINAGTNVGLTSDYAGTLIPQGPAPDIGLYEYVQTSTPSVAMTAPANLATVSSTITVSASSTAVSPASIASVQFYLDGAPLGSPVTTTSSLNTYSFPWNTATASNASHTLNALATDNYTNTASSTAITVTVSNVAPSITAFSASPNPIAPNGTSTLSWTVAGATSLSIDHGVGTVTGTSTTTPALAASTVFTLTATNANGSVTATTSVQVATAIAVSTFSLPATSTSLTVPILSFTASGTATGYYVSELVTTPSSTNPAWTSTATTTYTFLQAGNTRTLYAWVKDGVGNISSPASTTVSFPYYAMSSGNSVQTLVSSGIVTSSAASVTSSTQITFVDPVQINVGSSTVSIPASTSFTTASSSDFTAIVATVSVTTADLPSNSGVAGAVQYGLTSISISLSQPVTIIIPVDPSYNGQSLPVYRKDAGTLWTQITTCTITGGVCSFTTQNLSSFAVVVPTAPAPTSSGSGSVVSVGGGYGLPYIPGVGIIQSSTTSGASSPSSTSSLQALIASLTAQLHALESQANGGASTTPPTTFRFSRNLSLGMTGSDVKQLQQYLIAANAGPAARKLAAHGATQNFGSLTKAALIEFQKKVEIVPASGYFGLITRTYANTHAN